MQKFVLKLNSFEKSLIIGFIFSILCSFVNFQSRCDQISYKVFRLHIIANSDSAEDQTLKIKVRDAILKKMCDENLEGLDEIKQFVKKNSKKLMIIAQNEVNRNGFNYSVKTKVCKSDFDTREYQNIVLPAGNYDALEVVIGRGAGKNWWCVLFPPMCVKAAEDRVDCKNVFSTKEMNILENKNEYEIRFKIVEIINNIHKILCNLINKLDLLIVNKIKKVKSNRLVSKTKKYR